MKKLLLGAAITAALFGGVANAAVTPPPAYGFTFDATTGKPSAGTMFNSIKIYMAGSSAAKALWEQALNEGSTNSPCLANTVRKFTDGSSDNQTVYICQLNTAINGSTAVNTDIPAALSTSKKNLVLYKRNSGGSYMGVGPVIESKGLIDFLNVETTTCTQGTINTANNNKFVSTTTCSYTAAAAGSKTSTTSTLAIPTLGVSDVNPQLFTVPAGNATTLISGTTTPTPNYSKKYSSLAITQGPQQVFGVVVSLKLRAALQEAQFPASSTCNPLNAGYTTGLTGTAESEACMPNLNSTQLAQIFAAKSVTDGKGRFHSWKQFTINTGTAANPVYGNLWDATTNTVSKPAGVDNAKVHICSRTIGSGTKAQFGIRFLGNGCKTPSVVSKGVTTYTTTALPIVDHFNHLAVGEPGEPGYASFGYTPGTASAIETTTAPIVHAMASSGGLLECIDDLDRGTADAAGSFQADKAYGATGGDATRWAIGFSGVDTNTTNARNARFIKIDGVAPTLANVVSGAYPDWVEATFQTNKAALTKLEVTVPGTTAMINNVLIPSFTTPSVLSFVNNAAAKQPFGLSGFLTAPSSANKAPLNGVLDTDKPINAFSFATRSASSVSPTDNCRTPMIYDVTGNNQAFPIN